MQTNGRYTKTIAVEFVSLRKVRLSFVSNVSQRKFRLIFFQVTAFLFQIEIIMNGMTHYGINFTITDIDLEISPNGQCVDYVQFWSGSWENMGKAEHELTDQLCGHSVSGLSTRTFLGKDKFMTMLFKTDGAREYSGFKAEYRRVDLGTLIAEGVDVSGIDGNLDSQLSAASKSTGEFFTFFCRGTDVGVEVQ